MTEGKPFAKDESLRLLGQPHDGPCEYCGATVGVRWCSSCTAYPWDGKGQNPNRHRALCEPCTEDHLEYWAEMWSYARPSL